MSSTAASVADRAAVKLLPDQAEIRLSERALAVTRVLITIAATLAAALAFHQSEALQALLLLYVTFAIVILLAVRGSVHVSPWLPLVVQAADLVCAAAVALLPVGGGVPFFSLLLLPIFTAAFRWGFREVMITTALVEAAIVGGALVFPAVLAATVLPRVVGVAAAGAAIGYLAEQNRRRRFEDRAIAVILGRARLGGRLGDTVSLVLASVRNAFRARAVLVVFQERGTGRMLLWRADQSDVDELATRPMQVPAAQHADYWFDVPGAAWQAWTLRRSRSRLKVVALDDQGRSVSGARLTLPQGFLATHAFRRFIGATLKLSDEWLCRLFVLDPAMGVNREQTARFALRLAQLVGPPLYANYLVRSVRTRAQALERSRIAREMHDGVTQSLLGLDMEIAVLRRRARTEAPPFTDDLARVHGIVRDEVVTVRELMEGVRVDDIGSGDLILHLSGVVDRFSRHTGISARFLSNGRQPEALSPNARRQIARIVHEALVNVRKHSGADRVVVRIDVDAAACKVSIEDDGRGFPFGGVLTQDELDAQRQGPRTIGERARIIGGVVTVESRPGAGSRVVVSVPLGGS